MDLWVKTVLERGTATAHLSGTLTFLLTKRQQVKDPT